MKSQLLIFLVSIGCTYASLAQTTSDATAYNNQRTKINNMLAQRSQKFGQYDQSLNLHTGIFGLQTKKDIRRSNDILMDIVKTDNDIYKQLKILLDFSAFQLSLAQDKSKEDENNSLYYMNTINKMQAANSKLKAEFEQSEKSRKSATRNFILITVLMAASILLLLRSKYAART